MIKITIIVRALRFVDRAMTISDIMFVALMVAKFVCLDGRDQIVIKRFVSRSVILCMVVVVDQENASKLYISLVIFFDFI